MTLTQLINKLILMRTVSPLGDKTKVYVHSECNRGVEPDECLPIQMVAFDTDPMGPNILLEIGD